MRSTASTLYIDDQDILVESLREAFEDEGLTLDYARSWAEGMSMFEVVGHELVVADYDLREARTGLRLLAEIKKLAPATRLILISGRIPESASDDVSGLVDIYLRRTDPQLLETILSEARAAHERSLSTDWQAIGLAHPEANKVNLAEVQRIEKELQPRLGRA